jgi:hypothetical protein
MTANLPDSEASKHPHTIVGSWQESNIELGETRGYIQSTEEHTLEE